MRALMLKTPYVAATLVVAALLCAPRAEAWSAEDSANYPMSAAKARGWTAATTRALVLEEINTLRVRQGLGALRPHAALRDAAQAHADYLLQHGQVSHQQQTGQAGFTGLRPFHRAHAAGYALARPESVSELFVIGLADAESAVAQLMSGPYHRHALLWAEANEIGIGLSAQPGLVLSLGQRPTPVPDKGPQWLLWPPPGQRDVPGLACCERPRPAGLEEFGMPVSVQTQTGQTLSVELFELRNAQGDRLKTALLNSQSDEWLRQTPHVAYLLPLEPLRPGQRYHVTLQASAGEARIAQRWHFDTAP